MSGDFHCKCDKGQPDKPCRIFDGNDELYHNSLLARQIAEILTNGGVAGVSVQGTYQNMMEYVKLIGDVDRKINLMTDSLDSIEHPSLAYVKRGIQITSATKKRSRLKKRLVELYVELGRLVGVDVDIIREVDVGTGVACRTGAGNRFKMVCSC